MKIEFICGTLCMLALLLLILMITRTRENFASFDTKVTLGEITTPDPTNPNSKPSASLKFDVTGNGAIPISISNLSDLAAASPTSLQGKNLPTPIDSETTGKAAALKSSQDSLADMRRAIRKELQTERRFQQLEDEEEDYEDDYESDMVDVKRKKSRVRSPALDQGCQYGDSNADSGCANESCPIKQQSVCDSSEYIRKDKIPCWGCTLPAATD
jgi:hypothetical protein